MLSEEAGQLARLVDMLTFARVGDAGDLSERVCCNVGELVEEVLDRFAPRLEALGFDDAFSVPSDLPRVRVARGAIVHALDNVIDNAIRSRATDAICQSARFWGSLWCIWTWRMLDLGCTAMIYLTSLRDSSA